MNRRRLEERLSGACFPEALTAAPQRLRAAAATLGARPVRIGGIHGDMGPSNVLVLPSGAVAVIDPNGGEGPVASDLAKLIAVLRTGPLRLASGLPSIGGDRGAERSLLAGYGKVDRHLLRLEIGAAIAHRWVDLETGAASVPRALLPAARRVLSAELASSLG
jgi:Ser/Thr protein kinase RdoA (MazF antagonist)